MYMSNFDFAGIDQVRVVAEMLAAAKAKITYDATVADDYPAGVHTTHGALTAEEYAYETAHPVTPDLIPTGALDLDAVTVTYGYVSGVGPVVTQTIRHNGPRCETRDYQITVDTESDDYDGATVRRCRDELADWAEGYVDHLRRLAGSYDISSHRMYRIGDDVAVDEDADNIDREDYIRAVTVAPVSEDDGITGVIVQFLALPHHVCNAGTVWAMYPVAVHTREIIPLSPTVARSCGKPELIAYEDIEYDFYDRAEEIDEEPELGFWPNDDPLSQFHVWRNPDETEDGTDDETEDERALYADYCGARPY